MLALLRRLRLATAAPPDCAAPHAEPIATGKEPVANVVDRVLPAVVNVTTDVYQADGTSGQGVGTGFIVREDGVIVTNCHVVEGGSRS